MIIEIGESIMIRHLRSAKERLMPHLSEEERLTLQESFDAIKKNHDLALENNDLEGLAKILDHAYEYRRELLTQLRNK